MSMLMNKCVVDIPQISQINADNKKSAKISASSGTTILNFYEK